MNIAITFRHMEATEAVRGYATEKIGKLQRFLRQPMKGHIAVGTLDEKIDGELFIPLLPEARAILLFSPRSDFPDKWDVKLWFGRGAPAGASIQRMRMKEFDPNYAGRWNAGSNSRNKGTTIQPDDYEKAVHERLSLIKGG